MDEYPNLSVILVTYKRTELAVRTILGLSKYLAYPRDKVYFYIADDGSPVEHVDKLREVITDCGFRLQGFHNNKFAPGTTFPGRGWNLALQTMSEVSPFTLFMEDDWELRQPLAISPYLRLLNDEQGIGMIRLGGLAVGNDVRVVGYNGIHYLEYLRSSQYCYSGNPHIRHQRFTYTIGPFNESVNPGDLELDYDARFRANSDAPAILRPADLSAWGVFGHIGTERTFS
jgi:hypothetical protein